MTTLRHLLLSALLLLLTPLAPGAVNSVTGLTFEDASNNRKPQNIVLQAGYVITRNSAGTALEAVDVATQSELNAVISGLSGYATITGVQTLTNKTLTSPAVNGATIQGGTINGVTLGDSIDFDTDAAAEFRNALGLGTLATQAANNVSITGGMISGVSISSGSFTGTIESGTGFDDPSDTLHALLPTQTGNSGKVLGTNGTAASWVAAGTGDVVGPASATDNALARFNGTTGKLVQNSSATLSDGGTLTVPLLAAEDITVGTTGGDHGITFLNGDGFSASLFPMLLTDDRTFQFPDESGTLLTDQTPLSGLADVAFSSLTLGQGLTWDGDTWVNTTFAASALTDTTNAGNITTGTLAVANGGTGTTTSTGTGSVVLSNSPTFPVNIVVGSGTYAGNNVNWSQSRIYQLASGVILMDNASNGFTRLQLGNGLATPGTQEIRANPGSGTNITGGTLNISAGPGTGSAASGDITFSTHATGGSSGTTAGTPVARLTISASGVATFSGNIIAPSGMRVGFNTNQFGALLDYNSGLLLKSTVPMAFSSATDNSGDLRSTISAGFSHLGAATIAVGNGTAGNTSGTLVSAGQRVVPSTAPAAPASGWTIFCDSGDGNKLKAIYSSGTIVTLGTP